MYRIGSSSLRPLLSTGAYMVLETHIIKVGKSKNTEKYTRRTVVFILCKGVNSV